MKETQVEANNINIKSETAAAMKTKNVNDDARRWGERVEAVLFMNYDLGNVRIFQTAKNRAEKRIISTMTAATTTAQQPLPPSA